MNELEGWTQLLARQARSRPLKFVTGMRHAVKHDFRCEAHSHRSLEIVYHPLGRGCTRLPERQLVIPFEEQSAVLYAPNEIHDQIMETEGDDLCVLIDLPANRGPVPKGCLYVPRVEALSLVEDLRLLSCGYPRLSPAEQAIFDLRATTALLSLIGLYCALSHREAASKPERYVLKAEEYIREHLFEIESVPQIAEEVGISPHHLRHLFKALRGKSVIRHINEMRIDRAKSFLAYSRLPLKQIASLCGFRDEYYFSSVFRSLTHFAPGAYRQRYG